jgi:GDP-mannose 6-dehydrogenase
MKVSIFGLGYVGCVTAGCLGNERHEVVGVDVVAPKVEKLNAGVPTVVEPGLERLVAHAHQQGRITATTDGIKAVLATDASIICVGTPTGADGNLDLTALKQTAALIGQAMQQKATRHAVILRSTIPAGTAESVVVPALQPQLSSSSSVSQDCNLVVVPEFLREGSAIQDYYEPPFVVVGSATGKPDSNKEVVQSLFGGVADKLHWAPFREAEMLKATCNVFHALKVAFANEVGALCSTLSVDSQSLMSQFVQDEKLNISPAYMRPGLPFGGSCLPKELRMIVELARRSGADLPLMRSILPSNEAHLKRAIHSVPRNGQSRVGMNALAFKPGTDDLRESPLVLIAEHLIREGFDVKIHDPAVETSLITGANRDFIQRHIPHLSSRMVGDIDELVEHSQILLIARDDKNLIERLAQLTEAPMIVDLRGQSPFLKQLLDARKRPRGGFVPV